MKKKILIGLVAVGASVAVLGGCGGSENTSKVESTTGIVDETTTESVSQSTTDNNYPVELDESKRPKFDEETDLYSLQVNDKAIFLQFPKSWSTFQEEDVEKNNQVVSYKSYPVELGVSISVYYDNSPIDEDRLKRIEDNVAHTTVDGLSALYVDKKNEDDLDYYAYYIPYNEKRLVVELICPQDDENKDKHIKSLDMVVSSIDTNGT